jgi:hypothetical protein
MLAHTFRFLDPPELFPLKALEFWSAMFAGPSLVGSVLKLLACGCSFAWHGVYGVCWDLRLGPSFVFPVVALSSSHAFFVQAV